MDDLGDDEAISKLLKKPLKANVEELVKTKPEPLSGRISGLLEEPVEEGRNTLLEQRKEVGSAMDDDDDDVPICKLLQKFDLPQGKAVGKLKIRACWHDIVFRNEFGFTERMFLYT